MSSTDINVSLYVQVLLTDFANTLDVSLTVTRKRRLAVQQLTCTCLDLLARSLTRKIAKDADRLATAIVINSTSSIKPTTQSQGSATANTGTRCHA